LFGNEDWLELIWFWNSKQSGIYSARLELAILKRLMPGLESARISTPIRANSQALWHETVQLATSLLTTVCFHRRRDSDHHVFVNHIVLVGAASLGINTLFSHMSMDQYLLIPFLVG
jgi:hypothetical protein